MGGMDERRIEREVWIEASPATVFEVITSPQHLREWWPDEAVVDPTPGATGHLVFGDHVPVLTVADAVPGRLFSFRWTDDGGETLLVTFTLEPHDGGTRLHMVETGFVDADRQDGHESGWDHYLPRLVAYAPTVEAVG